MSTLNSLWNRSSKWAGWIRSLLYWLTGGLLDDRVIHPLCLRYYAPHPPCLSSLFKQEITAKKAAKGLLNSGKGIRGESCTSNAALDPLVARVVNSCKFVPSVQLLRGSGQDLKSLFRGRLTCRVAKKFVMNTWICHPVSSRANKGIKENEKATKASSTLTLI